MTIIIFKNENCHGIAIMQIIALASQIVFPHFKIQPV
jgi:hypothetical protein